MSRWAVLALVFAGCSCNSKPAATSDPTTAPPAAAEKVSVPGAGAEQGAAVKGGPPGGTATPTSGGGAADNPQFHLQPDEGTLTIDKLQVKAGSETTASVKVDPAAGYHVNTDYPTSLKLEAPADIKLDKIDLAKADAKSFTEKLLQFDVKATAAKPGTYEIKGTFKFAVCQADSCHPKKQPITILLTAS